ILSTKALEITPDPGGHVILKAVQFLVEIGSSGHARSKGMHSICSGGEGRKRHTAVTPIPIKANKSEKAQTSGHGGGKRRSVTAVLSYSDAPRRDMLERGESPTIRALLLASKRHLTLSEKGFCRQRGDMWCFDNASS